MGSRLALATAAAAIFVCAITRVNRYLPYPYMDEIFHVPQTLKYINGEFTSWDPKITTPPGLYVLGVLLSNVVGQRSVEALRWSNAIGSLLLTYLVSSVLKLRSAETALIFFSPLLTFYVPLYYTDVWASLIVMLALAYTYHCRDFKSAVLLTTSIGFRQTNIVWAAFAGVLSLKIHYSQYRTTGESNFTRWILRLIRPNAIWLYAIPACTFLVFLKINGSIALGDKSNHSMSLHLAQLLYFPFFSALSSAGQLPEFLIRAYFPKLLQVKQLPYRALEIAVIAFIIAKFTIAHPFVLSDNRHYTFYLWRRVLHPQNYGDIAKYAMVPVYHFCCTFVYGQLPNNATSFAFLAALALVLVPSPLLEPRYYALPYLVWRVFVVKKGVGRLEWSTQLLMLVGLWSVFCLSSTHFMF